MSGIAARLGLDYGGTNLKMGLFGEEGTVLRFREDRLEEFTRGGDLMDNILEHVTAFVGGERITRGGFASKGVVDTHAGTVLEDIGAGSLLVGIPLRDIFEQTFGAPFVIDNDARAYAWGEYRFGAGRGSGTMVCMTLGTGIGCALIAGGTPYEGSDALGGLLGGHLSIDRNGVECPCGSRGCLERYCSATAMHALVRARHPDLAAEGDMLETFFRIAAGGPMAYRDTLDAFLEALALGIVNVIHAYGPDTVVLGGGVMNSADVFLPGVRERVARMAWSRPRGSVRVVRAELGNRAAALGAAFHPAAE